MRIAHLDGLRGVAIILVVLYHALARWVEYFPDYTKYRDNIIIGNGWLGVELFFMISGFVIFLSLQRSKSFFVFMLNRYLRLVPAMLIAVVFIFTYAIFIGELRPNGAPSVSAIVPAVLMVHEDSIGWLVGIDITPLEGAFWTLCVELKFYIFIGFSYFLLGQRGSFYVAGFFSILSGLIIYLYTKGVAPEFLVKAINFLSLNYLPWFYIGMFVAYFRLRLSAALLFLYSVSVSFFLAYLIYSNEYYVMLCSFFLSLLFVFPFSSSFVSSFISNRFLLFMGAISYPLYLIHENFVVASTRLFYGFFGGYLEISTFVSLCLTIAIASVIAYKLEARFSGLIKNRLIFRLIDRY